MDRKTGEKALRERIRNGHVSRADVTRRLAELAFGKANDCVRLALEDDWSAGPGYSITIGSQPMPHVVSFSAQRAIDDEVTNLASAKWNLVMEELLIPGYSEPPDPSEPFALKVSRSGGDETFTGCRWTSQQRQDTIRGVTQTRKGTADKRTVMGIL